MKFGVTKLKTRGVDPNISVTSTFAEFSNWEVWKVKKLS
jgi:hypothetical protein